MRTRQNPENNTWSLNTLMCVNKETVASSLSAAGTREEQGSQLAYCSCPKHLLKGRLTWATRGIGAFQEAPAPSHVAQFVLRKPLSPAVVWRRVLRCGRRCREQSSCPPRPRPGVSPLGAQLSGSVTLLSPRVLPHTQLRGPASGVSLSCVRTRCVCWEVLLRSSRPRASSAVRCQGDDSCRRWGRPGPSQHGFVHSWADCEANLPRKEETGLGR